MKKERETANKYRQQALEGDLMAMNNRKESVINGKNVLRTVALASSCLAVAAMLAPATPVIGGIGLVCSKTIPSWLRGHAFF